MLARLCNRTLHTLLAFIYLLLHSTRRLERFCPIYLSKSWKAQLMRSPACCPTRWIFVALGDDSQIFLFELLVELSLLTYTISWSSISNVIVVHWPMHASDQQLMQVGCEIRLKGLRVVVAPKSKVNADNNCGLTHTHTHTHTRTHTH